MFVRACMCDSKYFMVKKRVNSDRRQMWSHPLKAEDKKSLGQDLRIRAEWDISQDTSSVLWHTTHTFFSLYNGITG